MATSNAALDEPLAVLDQSQNTVRESPEAKILIVDHSPQNIATTRESLKHLNASIITAKTGKDALRQVAQHDIAVVLMDVQMPDMDGFEAATRIRNNESTKHLPIIFVTAIRTDPNCVFRGYDSGAVDYLFKPIEPHVLLAKMRVFLELWRRRQEVEAAHAQLQIEIDERKRVEQRLRVSQRLEALGRLVAGVGHEINNPLTYILTNIDIAHRDITRMAGQLPSDLLDLLVLLSEARMGAERIRRIVSSLKRFSMPSQVASDRTNVVEALDMAVRVLEHRLQNVGHLTKDIGAVPKIRADSRLLEQVFVNVLMNALDALPPRHIEANEIKISTRVNEDRVVIEVSDNGRGIEPEHLDKVFDPFFTTKDVGEGTGLGLSICHEVLTSLGGEITIAGEPNRGTTVHISLPVASETSEPENPPPDARKPLTRPRILLVDDDPLILRSLQRQLSRYDLVTTTSAREGIALCAGQCFDLIICDLMMPGLSGVEFYNAIQRDQPGLENRIIFVTGGAFTPGSQDLLATVPNGCLRKPFDREELHDMLLSTLRRSRTPAS